jgi:hypothetical protein
MTVQELIDQLTQDGMNRNATVIMCLGRDTGDHDYLVEIEPDMLFVPEKGTFGVCYNEPADDDWAGPDDDARPCVVLLPRN